ncbi:hypothetical protein MRB53_026887 [Persea americana]|uniref:Uncharacterized protein n=1 Tax=Persea americana TaxID=3435 RepID=A0ACC2LJB8_PERAE|nr:hypothetical protein MRB53_026887 [Persea americana]
MFAMGDFFVLQPDLSKKMREGGENRGLPTNAAWVATRSPLVKTKSLQGSLLRSVARSDGDIRDEWLLCLAARSAREDEGERREATRTHQRCLGHCSVLLPNQTEKMRERIGERNVLSLSGAL